MIMVSKGTVVIAMGFLCHLSMSSATPCSPCSTNDQCIPYLEFCQLPFEPFDMPDFLGDSTDPMSEKKDKMTKRVNFRANAHHHPSEAKNDKNDAEYSGQLGLIPDLLSGLEKRDITLGDGANKANAAGNGTSKRRKRMAQMNINMISCKVQSVFGIKREEKPFTCQVNQIPLLMMLAIASFLFTGFLCFCCTCGKGCCCCLKPCCKSGGQDNLSSRRDVVMIRA